MLYPRASRAESGGALPEFSKAQCGSQKSLPMIKQTVKMMAWKVVARIVAMSVSCSISLSGLTTV